jgi:glutathione S-transferase
MIRLYGLAISNYYNMVKLALFEKGFEFQEVPTPPGQDADYLAKSPMGKMPCLEVREGFLSETDAILEFLEEVNPEIPLFPETAFERARVRQIMYMAEKYVDDPVRPVIRSFWDNSSLDEHQLADIRDGLARGIAALGRVARFDPWIAGEEFTAADIVAYYALQLAASVADTRFEWDIYDELPGLRGWRDAVADRYFVQRVDEEQARALESFMKNHTDHGRSS